ncbi:TIGR04053 family radical SAM/SPASM domain-containing protein [soil metagenome]
MSNEQATEQQSRPVFTKMDFQQAPYLVLWELTRACALACQHCRAEAIANRNASELSTEQSFKLLKDLQEFGRPLLVLTGGDPVQRPDLFEIIKEARHQGFTVAITPSATESTTRAIVEQFKSAGVARLAISLDGPDAHCHDTFRGVEGSFARTLEIVSWAHENKLPLQINTTISRHNIARFNAMAETVASLSPVLWSIFFLVPTGRATQEMQITAAESESVLNKMVLLSRTSSFDIKSTAAPHFRRVLIESLADEDADVKGMSQLPAHLRLGSLRSYQSVNDGKGLLFISHTGEIYPSGFLPLSAGNVKVDNIASVYRNHDLFKSLRDPKLLTGKCGYCRYKAVCGGSRARALAESGDYLGQDSLCVYDDRSHNSLR